MPRAPRLVVPGFPHHVGQRGHNRSTLFACDRDFAAYVRNLIELKRLLHCKVFAYCLLSNHVHLLVVPPRQESLGLLMQRLAGRYTRYFNERSRRGGTAWEERFHSSPIGTDAYLLACCRYVDLNPVRAGIVASAGDYRWSSYNSRVGRVRASWLDEDPAYLELGRGRVERAGRYAAFVESAAPDGELDRIREALRVGRLVGTPGTDFRPSPFSSSGVD